MNYQRGKQIIDGGEGFIFEVQGYPDWLMKIYKEKDAQGNSIVTSELTEKLEYMRNNPPSSLIAQGVLAWPLETIYEEGKLIGFLMPRLVFDSNMKDVCSFKHPVSDNAQAVADFPSVKSRILIAINLVSTIHELHKSGYVIGDLNHENIGINRQTGRISIVDCDSFHIVDNRGKAFRTKYVMPGYLAPEIIEHCYEERANGRPHLVNEVALPTFTQESDSFCLAKHIFKLLMNGTDPFTGVLENTVGSAASPFQGNEAIERNAYLFKSGYYAKAKFCLTANEIPNELIALFKRAFVDGHTDKYARPSSEEWHHALENYLNSLSQCSANPKHQHLNTLTTCPFCAADNRWAKAQGVVGAPQKPVQPVTPSVPQPVAQPYRWQTPQQSPTPQQRSDGGGIAAAILLLVFLAGEFLLASRYYASISYGVSFAATVLTGILTLIFTCTSVRKRIPTVTTIYCALRFVLQIAPLIYYQYIMSDWIGICLVWEALLVLLLIIQIAKKPKSVALSVWVTIISVAYILVVPSYHWNMYEYGIDMISITALAIHHSIFITTTFMSHYYNNRKI